MVGNFENIANYGEFTRSAAVNFYANLLTKTLTIFGNGIQGLADLFDGFFFRHIFGKAIGFDLHTRTAAIVHQFNVFLR